MYLKSKTKSTVTTTATMMIGMTGREKSAKNNSVPSAIPRETRPTNPSPARTLLLISNLAMASRETAKFFASKYATPKHQDDSSEDIL